MSDTPNLVVLAGPNGAGKSTAANRLLGNAFRVEHFVNADEIAKGLSAFRTGDAAMAAGRVMLQRLKELAAERSSFAFETTLASRTFAPWIAEQIRYGYSFHLIFLWLPRVEMSIERVAGRIRDGGHAVPEETIRRRYEAGLRNFFELYGPLTTGWTFYDNSSKFEPRRLAKGRGAKTTRIYDSAVWKSIKSEWGNAESRDT
jgi:predicted ABC-type ATPase